jgi:hypothetical protein
MNEKIQVGIKGRQERFNDFSDKQRKILIGKGHDYTAGQADVDAYANFRIIGELLQGCPITPYTIALIYGLKHLFSLITFCKTGKQESGEGLEGRHLDLSNYSFILSDLVNDHLSHFKSDAEQVCLVTKNCDDFVNELRKKIEENKRQEKEKIGPWTRIEPKEF